VQQWVGPDPTWLEVKASTINDKVVTATQGVSVKKNAEGGLSALFSVGVMAKLKPILGEVTPCGGARRRRLRLGKRAGACSCADFIERVETEAAAIAGTAAAGEAVTVEAGTLTVGSFLVLIYKALEESTGSADDLLVGVPKENIHKISKPKKAEDDSQEDPSSSEDSCPTQTRSSTSPAGPTN